MLSIGYSEWYTSLLQLTIDTIDKLTTMKQVLLLFGWLFLRVKFSWFGKQDNFVGLYFCMCMAYDLIT